MVWMHLFERLSSREQEKEFVKLIESSEFLHSILGSGHSDIHYFGNEENTQVDWGTMLDTLYGRDDLMLYMADSPDNVLPSDKDVQQQINRVAKEHVLCSTFLNRETALSAMHEVMSAGKSEILDWLREEGTQRRRTLVVRANLDTVLGTGIAKNGNERFSTSCAVVLDRETTSANGDIYPFRIRTCYPDITLENPVGGVWASGRSFAEQLQNVIASTDELNKQRWVMETHGEICTARPNSYGIPTVYVNRTYGNVSYFLGINETHKNQLWCTYFVTDERGQAFPSAIPYARGYAAGISAETQKMVGLDAKRLFDIYQSRTAAPEYYAPEPAGYLGEAEKTPSFYSEELR